MEEGPPVSRKDPLVVVVVVVEHVVYLKIVISIVKIKHKKEKKKQNLDTYWVISLHFWDYRNCGYLFACTYMGLNRRPQRGSPRAIFHSLRPQPLDYCSLQNICTIVYKCSTSGCSPHWHYHGSQDPPVALPSLATQITTTTSKSS